MSQCVVLSIVFGSLFGVVCFCWVCTLIGSTHMACVILRNMPWWRTHHVLVNEKVRKVSNESVTESADRETEIELDTVTTDLLDRETTEESPQ